MSQSVRMSQVIVPAAFTELSADADKRTIIAKLAEALAGAGRIPTSAVNDVIEETMRRESVGSTGIGHGIGIPHCRTALVNNIQCAYGRCEGGLDFDSLDGEPVYSVFLLLTPPDAKEQHLQLMRSFASQIRKEHFTEYLRQISTANALAALLDEYERQ